MQRIRGTIEFHKRETVSTLSTCFLRLGFSSWREKEQLTGLHTILDHRVVLFMAVLALAKIFDVQSGGLEVVSKAVEKVDFVVINVV